MTQILQKFKHSSLTLIAGLALLAPALGMPMTVLADDPALTPATNESVQNSKSYACDGIGIVSGDVNCNDSGSDSEVHKVIANVVNILSVIVGVAAVIMIIVGGFKYTTSGGDTNKVASAKSTLIYAIIGLVIVALAQFIIRTVLSYAR